MTALDMPLKNGAISGDEEDPERLQLIARGRIIKGAMQMADMTQEELAKRLKVSTSFLSRVLNAKSDLNPDGCDLYIAKCEQFFREEGFQFLEGQDCKGVLMPMACCR